MTIEQKLLLVIAASLVALASYLFLTLVGVLPGELETALRVCSRASFIAFVLGIALRVSARRRLDT